MLKKSFAPKVRQKTVFAKVMFELKKDLKRGESICHYCQGTGLEIEDNIYGIGEDIVYIGGFPYKNQSLTFCGHCYDGIQRECLGCGGIAWKS